ncbi:MAG: magnesium transporter CorA family protein [Clostridiaceae bacterium]|nr:magnesium transporter CorA family protein [Clostridiaceae bacterium]
MLEIFNTRMKEINGRMVSELERLDQIVPECWINLSSPTEDELLQVEEALTLPPEFLRYPLDEEERPRIDIDDETDHLLIIADFPYLRREGTYTKYETQPVGIVLANKCLVTVSLRESSVLEPFKNNRVRDFVTGFRTRFIYQIMYAGAKEYLKLLRFMDKTIDAAEHQLNKSINNKELFKLMELGKSLIYFSTSLKSNESVLEKMMRGKFLKQYEEDRDLLEDVIIEYKQALEMANIYASIINGTMDAYASIISNNLNMVMKFMAAMTIVLAVPQVIASFFGQNIAFPFNGADFAAAPWPFIFTLVISVVATALTVWWLNKKDMF